MPRTKNVSSFYKFIHEHSLHRDIVHQNGKPSLFCCTEFFIEVSFLKEKSLVAVMEIKNTRALFIMNFCGYTIPLLLASFALLQNFIAIKKNLNRELVESNFRFFSSRIFSSSLLLLINDRDLGERRAISKEFSKIRETSIDLEIFN